MLRQTLDILCIASAVTFGLTIAVWLAVGVPYAMLLERRARRDPAARQQFDRFIRYMPWFHALAGSSFMLFFAAMVLRRWLA